MSERIKELAEQAKIEFTYDPTETPMRAFAECWEDDLEKFAELIVRECIACCNVVEKVEWIEPPTYELGVRACKVKIQTHFRVTE